jgi:hypothetical protein
MKRTAIRGHALQDEGAAYHEHPNYDYIGNTDTHVSRYCSDTPSNLGFALCECGSQSEVFSTTAARRRWHAEHKVYIKDVGT